MIDPLTIPPLPQWDRPKVQFLLTISSDVCL